MARDVETALVEAVATHGTKSPDAARSYLEGLKQAGRFQADVY
jgi:sulfite reductase (NADPH) flavoprotein alpha-component